MMTDTAAAPSAGIISQGLAIVRPAGNLLLVAICPRKAEPIRAKGFMMPEESQAAADWALDLNIRLRMNLYFTVNVTPERHKKAAKTDMTQAVSFWSDCDPQVFKHGGYDKARDYLLSNTVPALQGKATYAIDSGNGISPFFELRDPLQINGDFASYEALNDQVGKVWSGATTHNCDRVMRLPGTWNYPNDAKIGKGYPSEPRLARLLFSGGPIYTMDGIREMVRCRDLDNRFWNFLISSPAVAARYAGSAEGLADQSGSAMDFSMVSMLKLGGFEKDEARELLESWQHGSSTEQRKGDRYWDRCWERTTPDGNFSKAGPTPGTSSTPKASAPVSKLIAENGEAFVAGFKPPEYTIEGVLLRGYLYGITGKSNAGKTAIAVSLAACVGAGKSFGRHQSVVGRVLYLAGENPEDIRLRIKAYCVSMFLPDAFNNVTFISRSFSITQHFEELMELSESVGGFDLVLVDGKTSFFTGDEENDNTQAYAQALELRSLTRLVGLPSVAVLCHPNRAVEGAEGLLPRGGSAFLNELDGNLTAWNSGGVVSLSQNKIRGADFEPVKIKLDVFIFPDIKTNFGTPITSVIAKPLNMNESELLEEQAESEENRLLALVNSNPKATLREWATLLGWNDRNGQPMVSKVSRTLSQLKADKMVRKVRKNWKITTAGKAEING